MKPNFALSLSFDGIRLLHRAAGGWRIVGDVALEARNLTAELAALRKTAMAMEPSGVRCKLVIPNDQIRYMTIETPGMNDTARIEAARNALEAATPYSIDDLAYDISPEGDATHIAAVARQTLREAESFALEHKFDPVSFAAVPGEAAFLGEPFFGATQSAKKLLESGEKVVPDGIAVVVIGKADVPPPPAAPSDKPKTSPTPREIPAAGATAIAAKSARAPDRTAQAEADMPKAAAENTLGKTAPNGTTQPRPTATTQATGTSPAPTGPLKLKPSDAIATETEEALAPRPAAPTAGFASRRSTAGQPKELAGATRAAPKPPSPASATDPTVAESSAAQIAAKNSPPTAGPRVGKGLLNRSKPAAVATRIGPAAVAETAIAPENEAERLTVFGTRAPRQVGGKPRYLGLILTAILLVVLAGVAAWASVFLDRSLAGFLDRSPETGIEQAAQLDIPKGLELPENAGLMTASLESNLTDEDAAVLDALRSPAEPGPPPLMTEEELEAQYAVTGIWPRAPDVPQAPSLISLDDLYLTSVDPISLVLDAVALPDVARQGTDTELEEINSPAAAGTQFNLDERGLVVATRNGALSPDGFKVFLGRPPVVPPRVLARQAPPAEIDPLQTALAGLRPRFRPDGLIESNERATLDGLTRNELAAIRPEERPQSAQENALAAASLVPLDPSPTSPLVNLTDSLPAGSDQAVEASLRPDARPKGFSKIVERATREEIEEEEEETRTAAVAAPKTVTPSIPSSASVAREATVKNAINLRKVNLIGVYGKPSDRRALVRLANGRYQKVQVGDRIDGGRVSAIGDSELRYQKSGRNVVLTMPKG